jgi:hypothetical protein
MTAPGRGDFIPYVVVLVKVRVVRVVRVASMYQEMGNSPDSAERPRRQKEERGPTAPGPAVHIRPAHAATPLWSEQRFTSIVTCLSSLRSASSAL